MGSELATFSVDPDVVMGIVNKEVKAGILRALNEDGELIQRLIAAVIDKKVDKTGSVSKYSSDNKYGLVDVVFENRIREIIKQAVQEMAEERAEELRAEVKKQVTSKKILDGFFEAVVDSLKARYSTTINVEFKNG